MALFLVQHGKSLSKEEDPDQGLSETGISEVDLIASVASGYKIKVGCIRHSGKTRAFRTAEIFSAALKPENGVEECRGMKPLDDVVAFAETINNKDNVMLVGHLPFMERLTSFLITGNLQQSVFRFQNGGILCLDLDKEEDSWIIKWALMPNIG